MKMKMKTLEAIIWVVFTTWTIHSSVGFHTADNVIPLPSEEYVYKCPVPGVLVATDDLTPFAEIGVGKIITSEQSGGVCHKVVRMKVDGAVKLLATQEVTGNELFTDVQDNDVLDVVEVIPSLKAIEHEPEPCLYHTLMNYNPNMQPVSLNGFDYNVYSYNEADPSYDPNLPGGTPPSEFAHVLILSNVTVHKLQDISIRKCVGHKYDIEHREEVDSHYAVMRVEEAPSVKPGDIIVSNDCEGFVETVSSVQSGDRSSYIRSDLTHCEIFENGDTALDIKSWTRSPNITSCAGGNGEPGIMIMDGPISGLQNDDVIVGRRCRPIVGEVLRNVTNGDYVLIEYAAVVVIDVSSHQVRVVSEHQHFETHRRIRQLDHTGTNIFPTSMSVTVAQSTSNCSVFSASASVNFLTQLRMSLFLNTSSPYIDGADFNISTTVNYAVNFRTDFNCSDNRTVTIPTGPPILRFNLALCAYSFGFPMRIVCLPMAVYATISGEFTINTQGSGFVTYHLQRTGNVQFSASWKESEGTSHTPPVYHMSSSAPTYDGTLIAGGTRSFTELRLNTGLFLSYPPQDWNTTFAYFLGGAELTATIVRELIEDLNLPVESAPILQISLETPVRAKVDVLSCPDPGQCNNDTDNVKVSVNAEHPAEVVGTLQPYDLPTRFFREAGQGFTGYKCFITSLRPNCSSGGGDERGDPHGDSLDHKPFSYGDAGLFLLSRVAEPYRGDVETLFKIVSKAVAARGTSFVEAGLMFIYGKKIMVSNTGTAQVDDQEVTLPYEENGISIKLVNKYYHRRGKQGKTVNERAISIQTAAKINLIVSLKRHYLGLTLPGHYRGKVEGLFGNFDGDPTNDERTCDGRDLSHEILPKAEKWKLMAESCLVDEDGELINEAQRRKRRKREDKF
ncbi:uncharacterized protein LOC106156194 [Lingula anatina]|uniref:Uncharacterized protein LOC106156194 n=1 Tax=Lingula anatina TaxID=7574 RepID=A0A1S3HP06_LINAN|nr:uncharacterized protein LOC106156194 [Lingula anatina]|eukprot:XP_013386769.1 uncharacterized protein LOC106156194 [Lingula anatina]